MVTVPAIAEFEHEGRVYRCGESVILSPVMAAAFARLGYVSIVAGYQPKALEAEPQKRRRGRPRKNHDAPKRTYRRRDLTAE